MSLPVVLRPEASRDLEEVRDYLEAQQSGLGQAFLDRVNEALARISTSPEIYAAVWRNVRAARLRKFTYVIYYRVHSDHVEVLALLHGSRDSTAWQSRA